MARTSLALAALATTLVATATATADEAIPGAPQNHPIALLNATIHTVSGPVVERGTLVFAKGKITAVGENATVPPGAEKIDLAGQHVYPGLVEPLSNIGLIEINAVRATRDGRETGTLNPNVKSWVSVNPDSALIPVTRSNGVLLCGTVPSGGLLSGQSAMLQLDGWTYEDLTLKAPLGMHVDWPRMTIPRGRGDDETRKKRIEKREEALRKLTDFFDAARAYQEARAADAKTPVDLRYESFLPVLERKVPLIVEADGIAQIQAAVSFAERQDVKLILAGGYDAAACANLLRKHDVPVIVGGVYRLPRRRSEPYDTPYTLPARLKAAGIRFCISGKNRFGASNARNLPYHAATAAAFGLTREEALRAITLDTAEILGLSERVGSLDEGKDATLFVADGDVLETSTQIESAWIRGRTVDLGDKHRRLYRKYREKYRRRADVAE